MEKNFVFSYEKAKSKCQLVLLQKKLMLILQEWVNESSTV